MGFDALKSSEMWAKCYCEENVYKLAQRLVQSKDVEVASIHVVFVSNRAKKTPIWMQESSPSPQNPVIWDYHVILLAMVNKIPLIFDLDSTLPFPSSAQSYIEQAFRPLELKKLQHIYHPMFRLIPVRDFLDYFASDRSHMRSSTAQTPVWPLIRGPLETRTMNLHEYLSMEFQKKEYGIVHPSVESFQALVQSLVAPAPA